MIRDLRMTQLESGKSKSTASTLGWGWGSCYITAWGKEEQSHDPTGELLLPHLLISIVSSLSLLLCYCDKTLTANALGWKGFILVYRLQSIVKGIQGRSLKQKYERMLPQACSSQGGTTHSALGPPPLISNQENAHTEPIWWWQCLSWCPFFPALSNWQPRLAIILPKGPTSRCHQLWIGG